MINTPLPAERPESPIVRLAATEPLDKSRLSAAEGTTPRIPSHELFGGGRRLIIDHGGRQYSLLITRQGKLVLNRC